MRRTLKYLIRESSQVGEARRGSVDLARNLGFNEVRQGEVAIIVTELATNLIKHARDGELVIADASTAGAAALDVLALDCGAGIQHPGEVLRDGYSTAGTAGTGLGAVRRMAARFDLHSLPGVGTAVYAHISVRTVTPAAGALDIGIVHLPYPGETVSGDGVSVTAQHDRVSALLVDGLGHGMGAHDAARAAVDAFNRHAAGDPAELLTHVHHGLRGTRGGVAGVVSLNLRERRVLYSGMGNISAAVHSGDSRRGLISQNGTLGQTPPKPQQQEVPWHPGSVLVLHSDGLSGTWSFARYPGLTRKPAALIAGVLYRDHIRGRDDVAVLAIKERV